jgi:hypothetical protein
MAYCPQCLTEYSESSRDCMDCHVPLVAGAPPSRAPASSGFDISRDEELVRVRTFSGPTAPLDAELARNILAEEGIPCILPGEGAADMLPGIDLIQLLVHQRDAEKAAEILENYLDHPQAPLDENGNLLGE